MKFNIDKCMLPTVTLKKHPLPLEYHLHNHKLTTVTKDKYLGVTLDSTLSFNIHIDSICKKANSVLSFIQRNFRKCHRKVKIDAHNYFVKPILDYSASVWTPHSIKYITNWKPYKNAPLGSLCWIFIEQL